MSSFTKGSGSGSYNPLANYKGTPESHQDSVLPNSRDLQWAERPWSGTFSGLTGDLVKELTLGGLQKCCRDFSGISSLTPVRVEERRCRGGLKLGQLLKASMPH